VVADAVSGGGVEVVVDGGEGAAGLVGGRWGVAGDGEVLAVDFVVVVVAEQDSVVEGGGSEVAFPPQDVVDLAPAGVGVAVGPGAFAVAGDDGAAVGVGVQALGAAEVDG